MLNSYYGCEDPESVSYLEFGSLNLVKGEKSIWGYWQDQTAYDLYMFARYSRDLIAFRKFYAEQEKTVETLNSYVLRSAHHKPMDYILKRGNGWIWSSCSNKKDRHQEVLWP